MMSVASQFAPSPATGSPPDTYNQSRRLTFDVDQPLQTRTFNDLAPLNTSESVLVSPRTSGNLHWNYFLALEADAVACSRYVEFSPKNYGTFSIEFAHLLMSAVQEVDVLLKQICAKHGDKSEKEFGYRSFLPSKFPAMGSVRIRISSHNLDFVPFAEWLHRPATTPSWWTASNKIKHERHTEFERANLNNTLLALSALLVANIYFLLECENEDGDYVEGTKLFKPDRALIAQSPAAGGAWLKFRHP
jgi:hypothetical protein